MKQKGISLIVLVITIIVMIILAGAIIISLTNGNVIAKAKIAKESSDFVNIREMVEMEKGNMWLNNSTTISGVTIPATYTDDIMVSSTGGIFLKPNVSTKISDIGNALDKLGAAYMPTGFEHVTGTLDDGIVIKNTIDGNEFVWVPVPDITKFYLVDSTNFIAFAQYLGTDYRPYNMAVGGAEEIEYNAMKSSVEKYKGFYIARYEAGKTVANPAIDGSVKPISKSNIDVWADIAWESGASEFGNFENSGAAKVARSMYPLVSATAVGMPVSTLIYGEQWDATMKYMKDVMNTTVTPNVQYITDSTNMGNYSDSDSNNDPAKTGDNRYTQYKVKNIYDMAGNVIEWTMETKGTGYRGYRGGLFQLTGIDAPASIRYGGTPDTSRSDIGFRPALYIK